jgi:hypothetical protein
MSQLRMICTKWNNDIDEVNKTITIVSIPKEEIKISPDIQFYDVSRVKSIYGDDYNKLINR